MEELKKAPVTVLLILANILVFTAVEFTGGSEDTMHMLQCGAAYTPAIMQGEYYRIFTSMFLHFGPQHLGNNMLVLFVLGGRLERTVGKLKYLLIYLLTIRSHILYAPGRHFQKGWLPPSLPLFSSPAFPVHDIENSGPVYHWKYQLLYQHIS